MTTEIQTRRLRSSFVWAALATGLLLILASQSVGQQKRPYTGLNGPGPVVKGTPDDPLRDPREAHLRHVKQLTFGGQNAEAYFSYDGQRLIFASNYENPGSSQFELYAVDLEGKSLERLTFAEGFTTFPMFSFDGKKLVFASNRNGKLPHEINIFVAGWVP